MTERDETNPDLVGTLRHELRQPLASIRGFTEMLIGHWDDFADSEKLEILVQVHRDALRSARLVDQLLDFSRLGSGQVSLRLEPTDIARVVEAAVTDVSAWYPTMQASLELGEIPTVIADPFKLGQVLANLLDNACRHGCAGAVSVSAARLECDGQEAVEVAVSDGGGGTAGARLAQQTERLLDCRLDAAGAGAGLGLWISNAIVAAHGGRLTATSVAGAGTTVRFTLPLRTAPGAGKLAGK